jgi:hypothetical protein
LSAGSYEDRLVVGVDAVDHDAVGLAEPQVLEERVTHGRS